MLPALSRGDTPPGTPTNTSRSREEEDKDGFESLYMYAWQAPELRANRASVLEERRAELQTELQAAAENKEDQGKKPVQFIGPLALTRRLSGGRYSGTDPNQCILQASASRFSTSFTASHFADAPQRPLAISWPSGWRFCGREA